MANILSIASWAKEQPSRWYGPPSLLWPWNNPVNVIHGQLFCGFWKSDIDFQKVFHSNHGSIWYRLATIHECNRRQTDSTLPIGLPTQACQPWVGKNERASAYGCCIVQKNRGRQSGVWANSFLKAHQPFNRTNEGAVILRSIVANGRICGHH